MRLAACLVVAACSPTPPRELVTALPALDATWRLDEPTWRRVVVEPYRDAYADYARAFDRALPRLTTALAGRHAITTRAHFAGDPALTRGEAWARWALPVMAPAEVAAVDGAALDAVFVRDGARWRAIVGIDELVAARVATFEPACADLIADTAPRCLAIAWRVADAALRADAARVRHACGLAVSLCGKRSP